MLSKGLIEEKKQAKLQKGVLFFFFVGQCTCLQAHNTLDILKNLGPEYTDNSSYSLDLAQSISCFTTFKKNFKRRKFSNDSKVTAAPEQFLKFLSFKKGYRNLRNDVPSVMNFGVNMWSHMQIS